MPEAVNSLSLTVQALLADSTLSGLVGTRIYPIYIPQAAARPAIAVHVVYQAEEELLQGASQWPEARVSVEISTDQDAGSLMTLGEAVISALRDKHLASIQGCEVSFRKEGSDETDAADQTGGAGYPAFTRRIIDFYVRWRFAS